MEHKLLSGFDEEICDFLTQEMIKKGINILFDTDIEAIESAGDCLAVRLIDGSKLITDLVMYATGRIPNQPGLDWRHLVLNWIAKGRLKSIVTIKPLCRQFMHWAM